MCYLSKSYGGSLSNMVINAAYYCYTIYDCKHNMYYSGSRGVEGRSTHDLGDGYFTSSSVQDFVTRFKNEPHHFKFVVEYFQTRRDALLAEIAYHLDLNVAKHSQFYNAANADMTYCGAGSLLCKDSTGKIYRVSVQEYATGAHKHVCNGRMIARLKSDGSTHSILKTDFDPKIYTTQFADHVSCYDNVLHKKRRIPSNVFYSDPNRFVGITKGLTTWVDKQTNQTVFLTTEEYDKDPDRYEGFTKDKVVIKQDGKTVYYTKEEFKASGIKHPNKGGVGVYDVEDRCCKRISKIEYESNKQRYANTCATHFLIIDGIFFKSRESAEAYYKTSRGKYFPRLLLKDLHQFDKAIKVISREDHMKGK
jgi:hypothetical protein